MKKRNDALNDPTRAGAKFSNMSSKFIQVFLLDQSNSFELGIKTAELQASAQRFSRASSAHERRRRSKCGAGRAAWSPEMTKTNVERW